MVSTTGGLPIEKDDWPGTEIGIGAINPHVGFLTVLNLVVIVLTNGIVSETWNEYRKKFLAR